MGRRSGTLGAVACSQHSSLLMLMLILCKILLACSLQPNQRTDTLHFLVVVVIRARSPERVFQIVSYFFFAQSPHRPLQGQVGGLAVCWAAVQVEPQQCPALRVGFQGIC